MLAVRTRIVISVNFRYLIAAIFLSPILGVLLGSLVRDLFLLFKLDLKSWLYNVPAFIESGFITATLGLVFSLPVVLFYGVPVFYLLKKFRLQTVWMFALFGLLPSSIGVLINLFRHGSNLEGYYFHSILFPAFGGLFTAIIFWFISVHLPLRRNVKN